MLSLLPLSVVNVSYTHVNCYCVQKCVCCLGVSGVVGVRIYCRRCLCICQYYDCDIFKNFV